MFNLPKVPSFGEKFADAFTGGARSGLSNAVNFAQQMALHQQKQKEDKAHSIDTALGTIQQMRGLIKNAGPSNAIQGFFPGETQKNRAELEQLGRSLIPMVAAGVPIRNQREFDEYAKVITNPNSPQSKLEGALNGIESILSRSSGRGEMSDQQQEAPQKKRKSFVSRVSKSNRVKMQTPDGETIWIPKDDVKSAMEAGGKVIR